MIIRIAFGIISWVVVEAVSRRPKGNNKFD